MTSSRGRSRLWLPTLALVAGCGLFGGPGGRRQDSEPTESTPPSSFEVRLVSRCPRPVEICCGKPSTCVTVTRDKARTLDVPSGGLGDLLVTIKGATTGVYADVTFSTVVLDESCTVLSRTDKRH